MLCLLCFVLMLLAEDRNYSKLELIEHILYIFIP